MKKAPVMKKALVVVLLLGLVLFAATRCGGMNNDTPMDAAKVLIQACIDGDPKLMSKINHSSPLAYPPQFLLEQASERKLYKYKMSDFTFTPAGDAVVVTNKKAGLNWTCKFVREKDGWYFDDID